MSRRETSKGVNANWRKSAQAAGELTSSRRRGDARTTTSSFFSDTITRRDAWEYEILVSFLNFFANPPLHPSRSESLPVQRRWGGCGVRHTPQWRRLVAASPPPPPLLTTQPETGKAELLVYPRLAPVGAGGRARAASRRRHEGEEQRGRRRRRRREREREELRGKREKGAEGRKRGRGGERWSEARDIPPTSWIFCHRPFSSGCKAGRLLWHVPSFGSVHMLGHQWGYSF